MIEEAGRPLGPREVLESARSQCPGLGIATVYRTLKTGVEGGWLRQVDLPGDAPRYEVMGKQHHHHFHCRACDRGEVTRKDAAGAILYAAEKATWMALEAIQCLGGNGYINDFPAGRLLRDAKLYEIGAGTSEIRRMLIGREVFEKTR